MFYAEMVDDEGENLMLVSLNKPMFKVQTFA